jgi:hypothetical protein
VQSILTKPPRAVHDVRPDVPPKLEAVIAKALAKNVDERYRDAGEVHEQLRMISREAVVAVPVKKRRGLAGVLQIGIARFVIAPHPLEPQRNAVREIATAERLLEERTSPG